MDNTPTTANIFLALVWALLGIAVIAVAIFLVNHGKLVLAPLMVLLSVILFMLSAQRTQRFAIAPQAFQKRLLLLGITLTLLSSLSATYYSAV